jgi:ribosomal-protein-alanine N-acetyltransferase
MTITPIAPSDLPRLALIHAACFARSWSANTLDELLKSPGIIAFAASAGFVLARVASDEAEILTLAVLSAARRKGLGRSLVLKAAEQAAAQGARAMFLEAGADNAAALALYAGLGFAEVGRRASYYGPEQDAIVLRAGLPLRPLGIPRASTRL